MGNQRMRVFHGVAEMQEAIGTHLGYSDWHTVTQQQIDAFAASTGDEQWIHVDPEKAAKGPFGTTIAHGYLTLSLVPLLVSTAYGLDNVAMGVNYGANKVRFPAPVPVDSRIRAGVELLSITAVPFGHQVVERVTVEIEGGDKPACVVETVTLLA
jgi:acyl dehydratase